MGFEYIRSYYGVPAQMNREVIVDGKKGVIVKDIGNYIGVVFYGEKFRISPCHPTYKVEYLETFNHKHPKPKNAKSKERYAHYLSLDSDMTFFQYLKSKHVI